MTSTKKTARVAGLLYVLMSIPGVFSLIYVPSVSMASEDAAVTASKIRSSQSLFRLGIVSELIFATIFIFLVLVLYQLFQEINKKDASLMVILADVSVPISFLNVLNEIAALILLRGANFLSAFDQRQLDAMAMLFPNLHGQGFVVAGISWGLWLFPFGVLAMRPSFLPRILGVLLIVACFGYLAESLTSLLLPTYENVVYRFAGIPLAIAEPSIILWLLIKGAKVRPLVAAAS